MAVREIAFKLTAVDQLSGALKNIGDNFSSIGNKAGNSQSALSGIGKTLTNIGTVAAGAAITGLVGITTALGGVVAKGVSAAADLDQSMANIASVMGKTKEEVTPLKDAILDLSLDPNLKVSATEAASAVELLARNGLQMSQILDGAAKSTVALANATGADFGNAADIATDVMALFNIEAKNMEVAIDGITGVTTNSKFSIDDYGLALASVGGIASGMGVSLEDMNAVLAGTASSFSSGRTAGTSFKTMLQRLANPTSEMVAEMDKYGISLFDGEGKMRSMAEVAQQLHNVFEGTATITKTVGGVTAEMQKAAESAAKKMPALSNTIEEQQSQLAVLNKELPEVIKWYGEGSPAVDKHRNKILKLSNSLEENNAKMVDMQMAIAAVNNAREETITSTKQLTEEEKANLAAIIGGADGARTILALSKLTAEEFENLSGKVNANGQAMQAAATRVDSLKGAFEILKSVGEAALIKIGDQFLPLVRKGVELLTQQFSDNMPIILDFFGGIADFIQDRAIPALMGLISFVQNLFNAFQAGGLGAVLEQLFGVGSVEELLNNLASQIPALLGNVLSAAASFLAGGGLVGLIVDMDRVPEVFGNLVNTIVGFLTENWPTIQATLQEWATMFFDWVDSAIGQGQARLGELLSAIVAWASDGNTQSQLTEMGMAIGETLVTGFQTMMQNTERVAAILTELGKGLLAGVAILGTVLIAVGAQIVAGIIAGIIESITGGQVEVAAVTELGTILRNIGDQMLTIAKLVGLNIILGISQGILDAISQLTTTVQQIGVIITETVKNVLGISSPSTVFFEFGVNMIQGLIDGIMSLAGSLPDILGGLTEGLGNLFSGLFGGAEDAQLPTMEFDPEAMLAGITQIQEAYATMIATVQTGTEAIIVALQNKNLLLQLMTAETLPALQEGWMLYSEQFLADSELQLAAIMENDAALLNLANSTFPAVRAAAMSTINAINAGFKTMATTAKQTADVIRKEFVGAAEKIKNELIPAVNAATEAFRSMEAAASAAGGAAKDAGRASGEAGAGGFGPKQHGGPVMGGKTYLVGEAGPELFVPPRSGRIIPNDQLSMGNGPTTIQNNQQWHLHIHSNAAVPENPQLNMLALMALASNSG